MFRVKTNADGALDKLKARLVPQGFEQYAGVNFYETFSPVVIFSTSQIVFALTSMKKWKIQQIDVNNAFLNGTLQQKIYIKQPAGFEDPQFLDHICLL